MDGIPLNTLSSYTRQVGGLNDSLINCIDAPDFEEYIKKKVPVKHYY